MKEINVKLSNGFTFLIDFANSEVSETLQMWESYYRSHGIRGFEISSQDCKVPENLSRYNYWHFSFLEMISAIFHVKKS